MRFQVVTLKEIIYIDFETSGLFVKDANDVMDILSLCHDNDTTRFLFYQDNFSDAFFDLKTGLAGELMQKFGTYFIRAAIIIDLDSIPNERFHELVTESNRGNQVRFYPSKEEAVSWLVH